MPTSLGAIVQVTNEITHLDQVTFYTLCVIREHGGITIALGIEMFVFFFGLKNNNNINNRFTDPYVCVSETR